MKKARSILLSGILIFGIAVSMVGCGNSEDNNSSEEISEEVSKTENIENETFDDNKNSTKENNKYISADKIGITSDELAELLTEQNIKTHDFEDLDEVETQVNLGAKMAFDSDSIDFTYTARANELFGLVVWSDNYDDADIAVELINGNTDMTDAWESLKSMAISQANLIDSWTEIALGDSFYHTATALMNNVDMSLVILVVYDGEIIYDVTEAY